MLGICAIILLVGLFKTRRPVGSLFASCLQGGIAYTAIALTSTMTGISIGINLYSLITSLILGIPGVILMLIVPFL